MITWASVMCIKPHHIAGMGGLAAEDAAEDGTGDEGSRAEEAEELSEARFSEDLEAEVEKTLGPTGNTY